MKNSVLTVVAVILLSDQLTMTQGMHEVWCNKTETDCHFTLVVNYGLTMMYNRLLVKAKGGHLYSYDATVYNNETQQPVDDVITADAYLEPKFVMAFNGSIPGPALHMYNGQKIHLRVINKMMHETTTVHLHGQHMRGSPYSDGVPFVTQCPILPGQTFTQIFKANPSGSFYYHGHSGHQLNNGLYGAFIVHPRAPETYDVSKLDPHLSREKQVLDEDEQILFLQDYNHDWDANMVLLKSISGLYQHGLHIPLTSSLSGINFSFFNYQSGLINGRGRHYKNGVHNGGPLSRFFVKGNRFYRLRLINTGDVYSFRVHVASHPLLVVATDGYDIDPVLVDSVVVNIGERFDVVIYTNQTASNYMILAETLEVEFNHTAEAILSYEGSPDDQTPQPVVSPSPTIVLNCPFSYYPKGEDTLCHNLENIRSRYPNEEQLKPDLLFQEMFMNFQTPPSLNGYFFTNPSIFPLTQQPNEDTLTCSRRDCEPDKMCPCPYTVGVKRDAVVQMIFTNIATEIGIDHPVHLHGHGFQVVKMVFPEQDNVTGKFMNQTEDIECIDPLCFQVKWRNSSWENGNIPGIDLAHAPTKDNVLVPFGGYVVVRFKADNPGLWIIHCHIGIHFVSGMAALISEDRPNWPKVPKGFPTCRNYEPDPDDLKEKSGSMRSATSTYRPVVLVAAILVVVN